MGVSELSLTLELIAHGVTAVLATWLGLLVLTRGHRAPGARVFSLLCLLLVTWSVAIIVQRVGVEPGVKRGLNLVEDISAFLLPAATLHIALSVAFEGRRPAHATLLLLGAYVLSTLVILQSALDPGHPIEVNAPHWTPLGIDGATLGWAFIALRGLIFGAAVWHLVSSLRRAGDDRARQQQLKVALATVVLGVIGGMARILPENIGGPPFIGVSLISVTMVMAAYAVLAQHVFLAADVTVSAVRWSVLTGLGVVAYVGILIAADTAVRSLLGVDFPLVIALAVVVTIALFDPVAERLRVARTSAPGGLAADRLLRALGGDAIVSQQPDRSVEPVLARLARTFDLSGAAVNDAGGMPIAQVGDVPQSHPLAAHLDLTADGAARGSVTFGPKRSGLAFTAEEREALNSTAAFLASTLQLADRHREQASALTALREEGSAVESRGSALGVLLAEATTPPPGLRVYALGPLRAERDGELVRRWGGEKAGSRQAEAVFAFLFDRGERGVAKDEILELVWPDVDLARADVAFHRTMLGLRGVLRPNGRARGTDGPITFHNDRYRIESSVVAWSDVAEFEALLSEADGAATVSKASLEGARGLYRGEYLDDCPFYGDSSQVEERREDLRLRYVDLLVDLAERHAARGDRGSAAACLREAQTVSGEEVPRIEQALARLTADSRGAG
ncbi:MAG: histidine kinase N-terminal 7TM domain-containing protein [Chloroflexota bacterium]